MAHYLAEAYTPRDSLASDAERLGVAALGRGTVRLLDTLYLLADEVCFYLFESDSAELVEAVCASAGLRIDRVQPALVSDALRTSPAFTKPPPVGRSRTTHLPPEPQ